MYGLSLVQKNNCFLDIVDRSFQLVTTAFRQGFPTAIRTGRRKQKRT